MSKPKILVLGAGGTGGYFGGRLAESGADVTFLVREGRRKILSGQGLRIESPFGDAQIAVKTVVAPELAPVYDAVILTCKAYDLDAAVAAIAPAVAPTGYVQRWQVLSETWTSTVGSAGSVWSSTRRRFATMRSMPKCFVTSPMSTCASLACRLGHGSSC